MIYTLFAQDWLNLPTAVAQEVQRWVGEQGVDHRRLAALAYNHTKGETWFRVYKEDPLPGSVLGMYKDAPPPYDEFFIPLQGKPPRQLEYFIPSESPPAWLGKPMPFVLFD